MNNKKIFALVILLLVAGLSYVFTLYKHEPLLKIIVVRHAESYKNLSDISNIPTQQLDSLTPKGTDQAKNLGLLLENRIIDLWVSSPTKRTKTTRDIVLQGNKKGGEKVENDDLVSMKNGTNEDGKEIDWQWREKNWEQGKDSKPTGGESLQDAEERVVKKINEWITTKPGKTIAIFTHSDICAALIGKAHKTPFVNRYKEHAPALAGYSEIYIFPDNNWVAK